MSRSPLVSVVIPTHNSARWVGDTLRSVAGQSYPNLDVIIVDDGSTDGSVEIAKQFGSRVFLLPNSSAGEARNHGFEHARGEYIQFLDSDDIISSDKIAAQVAVLEAAGSEWIAACPLTYFYDGDEPSQSTREDGEWIADTNTVGDWIATILGLDGRQWRMIPGGCHLAPRSLVERAGPWMTQPTPDDDGEFFLRLAIASKGIKGTAGRLYYRKFHNSASLSGLVNERWCRGVYHTIERKLSSLLTFRNDREAFRYAAESYAALAFTAYPDFPGIYRESLVAARRYGIHSAIPNFATPFGAMTARVFGWKAAKRLQRIRLKARSLGLRLRKTR